MTALPSSDPRRERADEYVLGLLGETEAAAVEREADSDPAMRAAIADARERFLALDLSAGSVEPSAGLWTRIENALGEQAADKTPLASTADTPAVAAPAPRQPANDNAVRRWRIAAFAGMAAAAVLAVMLTLTPPVPPRAEVVAVLTNDGGEPLAIIEDYGDRSSRVVPLAQLPVPEDRTLQVWTLPNEEMGPVSLGIFDDPRTTLLEDGPELPHPQIGQLYEITVEPEGGSPTGRPTGEIVGKGFARRPL